MAAHTQPGKEREDGADDMLIFHVSVSTLPFPLLSREGNWKEKGTGLCFVTRTCPRSSLIACERQMLLIDKLGYSHRT